MPSPRSWLVYERDVRGQSKPGRQVQRDEAKGEETRSVAAVNTAAECAGKSPPPEPGTGSRDGRYGGGGNRTRESFPTAQRCFQSREPTAPSGRPAVTTTVRVGASTKSAIRHERYGRP